MTARLSLLACCLIATGLCCCSGGDTLLVIELSARDAVPDPAKLEIRFVGQQPAETQEDTLEPKPGESIFPPTGRRSALVNIIANARRGPATISIEGLDAEGRITGAGSTRIDALSSGGRTNATLRLDPADFIAAGSVPLGGREDDEACKRPVANGRQVASAKDGRSVIVWDKCPTSQPCSVSARLYDGMGRARSGPSAGQAFSVSGQDSAAAFERAATAMNPEDGSFVVVWHRFQNLEYRVFARGFSANGSPVADARALSNSSSSRQDADVAALLGAKATLYVVVWAQRAGTNWQIAGHVITPQGSPVSQTPFLVETTTGEATRPAVAAGPDGGFLVAWLGGDGASQELQARVYDASVTPVIDSVNIPKRPTGNVANVGAFDVARSNNHYVLVWDDIVAGSADPKGRGIRQRLMRLAGTLADDEVTLNDNTDGNQLDPAIAALADGSWLVVWTTDDADIEPGGGLRAVRVTAAGVAGEEFPITTTRPGCQEAASLAAAGSDLFIMGFRSRSAQASNMDVLGRLICADGSSGTPSSACAQSRR